LIATFTVIEILLLSSRQTLPESATAKTPLAARGNPRVDNARGLCGGWAFRSTAADQIDLVALPSRAIPPIMTDQIPAMERIEAALQRIERAAAARTAESAAISRRHAALRDRMSEAVTALDAVLAQGNG
jgi:hypothetical protein